MASEKDDKIARARKFADAGQYVKAISAWRELLDNSPNDATVYNTIGDLCLKKKSDAEAADAYLKAAQCYLQEGFHLKAVALYKKVLKLEPTRAEVHTLLGDLSVIRGLMNNAVADYLSGAKLHLQAKQMMNALTLFRKIIKVDPKNMDTRLRVAELCRKENLTDEAAAEYLYVGREYQRQGREEDAHKLYQQILAFSPNHAEARRRLETPYHPGIDEEEETAPAFEDVPSLAEASPAFELELPTVPDVAPSGTEQHVTIEDVRRFLDAGEIEHADRGVRALLVGDPDRDEYQALLGVVYLKKGHVSVAYDMLCPIVKAWVERGRHQEALELIDAFLAVEADNADFLALKVQAGGVVASRTEEPVAVVAEPSGLELRLDDEAPAVTGGDELQFEQPVVDPSGGLEGTIEFRLEGMPLEAPVEPPATDDSVRATEVVQPMALEVAELAAPPAQFEAKEAKEESPSEMDAPKIGEPAEQLAPEIAALFDAGHRERHEQKMGNDVGTRYAVGVAYKEMGLPDEAVEEFRFAACAPSRFVDACTMIAGCYEAQNRTPDAIMVMERLLGDSHCAGSGVPYAKYYLAVLYEGAGMAEKAVRLYTEIPSISDVADRLVRLSGEGKSDGGNVATIPKRSVSYL